ncbi:hypothetical protein [Paractinoplanes globisporus]|uniref:Uncharacterized protein n=1 Tax=Paractinoplanes globisporus TaxID=113565 RepID=A0ABW6WVJ5_9ACTN|nr:hypothetical protein [Actinoplanes globisporus]
MDEVVDMATDDGPPLEVSVDDIVASGRLVQRRRRTRLAAGLAMAAVAAVAAAIALVPAGHRTGKESVTVAASSSAAVAKGAAGSLLADRFEFTFSGYSVGPVHVQNPIVAGNAYQIAAVTVDGTTDGRHPGTVSDRRDAKPRLDATLTLYRPGAYAVQRLAGATSTTVAGHRALKVEHHQSPGPWLRTLAWEYAPNAWAVLDSSADRADLPTMRQLESTAAALTGAAARPVTVPFRLSYVPAGYDVFAVGDHMTGSLDAVGGPSTTQYSGVFFAKSGLPKTGLLGPYDNMMWGAFQIMISANTPDAPGTPGCDSGLCTRLADGGKVTVAVASNAGSLSKAETMKVLNAIRLTDVQDTGTWVDIRTALTR